MLFELLSDKVIFKLNCFKVNLFWIKFVCVLLNRYLKWGNKCLCIISLCFKEFLGEKCCLSVNYKNLVVFN